VVLKLGEVARRHLLHLAGHLGPEGLEALGLAAAGGAWGVEGLLSWLLGWWWG
jgi:hypothetical protein